MTNDLPCPFYYTNDALPTIFNYTLSIKHSQRWRCKFFNLRPGLRPGDDLYDIRACFNRVIEDPMKTLS